VLQIVSARSVRMPSLSLPIENFMSGGSDLRDSFQSSSHVWEKPSSFALRPIKFPRGPAIKGPGERSRRPRRQNCLMHGTLADVVCFFDPYQGGQVSGSVCIRSIFTGDAGDLNIKTPQHLLVFDEDFIVHWCTGGDSSPWPSTQSLRSRVFHGPAADRRRRNSRLFGLSKDPGQWNTIVPTFHYGGRAAAAF